MSEDCSTCKWNGVWCDGCTRNQYLADFYEPEEEEDGI